MTARTFPATPAEVDHCQLGQLLGPEEMPATLSGISGEMQRALSIALDSDRIDWFGRRGWHRAGIAQSRPILDATIAALHARDLVVIVSRSKFRKHARITARGQWFARTVNTHLMQRLKGITQ